MRDDPERQLIKLYHNCYEFITLSNCYKIVIKNLHDFKIKVQRKIIIYGILL